MNIRVKNMVCDRCKMAVRKIFEDNGLSPASVALGEVELSQNLSDAQKSQLDAALRNLGFELLDDKKARTAEKIKNLIVGLVRGDGEALNGNLSEFLAARLHQDYSALSNLFSHQNGTTIEQFHILQKIERVKELLEYDELNLNQIAAELNYGSASHLTRQFRKITGQTPTDYKRSHAPRVPLNLL